MRLVEAIITGIRFLGVGTIFRSGKKHYQEMLTELHQMLAAAMKAKQTVDLANVTELNRLLKEFEKLYLAQHS